MTRTKKYFLLFLGLLLITLTFCACGKKKNDKKDDKTETIISLTLQGSDISDYTIVYPDGNDSAKLLADWVGNRIKEATKKTLTIASDSTEVKGKQILIGTTNREDCEVTTKQLEAQTYCIGADKDYVCLRGADVFGDYHAVRDFLSTLFDNASAEQDVKLKASSVKEVSTDDTLTAMSFNIYVGTPEEQREISVLQTILNYLPDTMGVQEASPEWMTYLNEHLGEFYTCVGEGRDGGENGEHNAIFIRKDQFEVVEEGTQWLSQTPFTVSRFPDAALNRIFTYAILKDKQTDNQVVVVNTHFDHITPEVRSKQATVLVECLEEYADYPIVLTGDFNDTMESEMYKTLAGKFSNSSKLAKKAKEFHTFHNYGKAEGLIDFIFVTQDSIEVSEYKVIKDKENGMLPSDHYPVLMNYKITKKVAAEVPDNTQTETPDTTTPSNNNPAPNNNNQTPSNNNQTPSNNNQTPSNNNAGSSQNVLASLTAMSFNVYVGDQNAQRQVSVLQTIRKYLPDTLGVQEADGNWMNYLNQNLNDYYSYVGEGRDGGSSGEYSAIFYRKDKFNLIDSGTKWLSDTPNTPSAFPESSLHRIFTYAVLQEKQSGTKVLAVNTHFDHSGPSARNRQVQVVMDFIRSYSGYPIVFTGDLNDKPSSDMYAVVRQELEDSSRIAKRAERTDTFHNYSSANVTLDYIFVTPDKIEISFYKVISDRENGMFPSDHFPVYIEYNLLG